MAKKTVKKEKKVKVEKPKKPEGKVTGIRVYNPKQTVYIQAHKKNGREYLFKVKNEHNNGGMIFSTDESMKPIINYFVEELGFKQEDFIRQ